MYFKTPRKSDYIVIDLTDTEVVLRRYKTATVIIIGIDKEDSFLVNAS